MIPLFFSSIYISKHLSIYSSESKEYKFPKEFKLISYVKEEFLLLLGFLFFFQTLYNYWNSLINTLLFYIFIDFHTLHTHDIILFEIIKNDLGYIFTKKDILLISYILLSFFLSKFQLVEIFILLFFQKYSSFIIQYIESNYSIPVSEYYDIIIEKGSEIIKKYKKKMIDYIVYKKEE